MYVPLTGSAYADGGAKITQDFVDGAISRIEAILEQNKGEHIVPVQWKGTLKNGSVDDLRLYRFQNGEAEVFFHYLLGRGDEDFFVTETYITGDEALCGLNGTLTDSLEEVFAELDMEPHYGIARQEPPTLEDC